MNALEALQSLDLTTILEARASIELVLSGEGELQALLDAGLLGNVLGDLGGAVEALAAGGGDPLALLQPLVGLLEGLVGQLDPSELPLAEYHDVVLEGTRVVVEVMGRLGFASLEDLQLGERGVGGWVDALVEQTQGFSPVQPEALGEFRAMVATIEAGVPREPEALLKLLCDALLPVARQPLEAARAGLDELLEGAAALRVPSGRLAGLDDALARVTAAAEGGSAGELEAAMAHLAQIRAGTLHQLELDLVGLGQEAGGLAVAPVVAGLSELRRQLGVAPRSLLDFLAQLRREVVAARQLVTEADFAQLDPILRGLLDTAETWVEETLVAPIEAQVQRLEAWVRGLLEGLPLASLRSQLTGFIRELAASITGAGLDGPAQDLRGHLQAVQDAVANVDLADELQGSLGEATTALRNALQPLADALATIHDAVQTLGEDARAAIAAVSQLLARFQEAIDLAEEQLGALDVPGAAQQVVGRLAEVRAAAEELLADSPLPEPLRPLVEQLVSYLRGLDLEELLLEPLDAATDQLGLPPGVAEEVRGALALASDAVNNLIPQELIARLDAQLAAVIDEVQRFDPATLFGELTGFFAQAADAIEGLTLSDEQLAPILGPFEAALGAFDALQPARLLAPAIEAYEELVGSIPLPEPAALREQAQGFTARTAERLGQAVTQPMLDAAAPGSESSLPAADAPAPAPLDESEFRLGDVARFLGFVPAKLKEALEALEEGPAGQLLTGLERLLRGLARELRGLFGALRGIEARICAGLDAELGGLRPARARAANALRARLRIGDLGEVELQAHLEVVASLHAGELREELGQPLEQACAQARGLAHELARAGTLGLELAELLEGSLLGAIGGELETLIAALDPEPLAAELDALMHAVVGRGIELVGVAGEALQDGAERLRGLIERFNPAALIRRFLRVLEVLREQLDLLSPRRLANELSEVHAALRGVLAAYDPRALLTELQGITGAAADSLRALDPAALLGDALGELTGLLDVLDTVKPSEVLGGLNAAFADVAAGLEGIDVDGLLARLDALPEGIDAAMRVAAEGVRDEILALLASIEYVSGNAQVGVSG